MRTWWLEHAWLGSGEVVDGVLVTVDDEWFTAVEPGTPPPRGSVRLAGLTLPGMANCHSHAFHRALRGRTQRGRGTFWTWREQMYALAGRLDPDSYHTLARATFREMVASGYTSVGEFHYLHHSPDGTPYDDANAMGLAVVQAARDAGIRIALLDTCYVTSRFMVPPEGVQVRFSDGNADAWVDRVERLERSDDVVVGAAVHSVRAVSPVQMRTVASWADHHQVPLHAHLSEQVAENEECLAAHGLTPTALLENTGVLGERTSVVHATHLTDADIEALGRTRTHACFCPTTERDLGDGIGPSRRLHGSGAPLTLGSDSHAVIDAFEEMRAVELDERLATRERGHWSAEELLVAGTSTGHASLGFPGAGRIEMGARADLVTLDAASPRLAGTGPTAESAVFAAGAGDVVQVVRDGRIVFTVDDRPELGRELRAVIDELWQEDQ